MYILKYAFKNIIRNPFISLSSLVVIGLLVFFINILAFTIFATDAMIASVNKRLHVMITLEDGYTKDSAQVISLYNELQERFPKMYTQYISQEDAFTAFQSRDPELAQLIEWVDENPLPNVIRLSNIPFDSYEAIQSTIANYKTILKYDGWNIDKKFIDFRSQYIRTSNLIDNLTLLKKAVYMILFLFLFTVFVVVYTVISNTIFFLRDEMSIIELVWWWSHFIYGPLVIQGMAYTGWSSILALWGLYTLSYILPFSIFTWDISDILTQFFTIVLGYSVYGFIGMLFLGMISALVASWKYIHKTIA